MKVYRGPSSKAFSDDAHELVATADVAKSISSWHDSVLLKVNVTKAPTERQAVAHLQLDSEDVMALHSQLITGLLARSAALENANARIAVALKLLDKIYNYVNDRNRLEGGDSFCEDLMDMMSPIYSELNPDPF